MASRLGVGIPHQWEEQYPGWTTHSLGALGEPYWYNWKYDQIAHPRYNPMLFRPDYWLADKVTPNPHWQASLTAAKLYGNQRLWFMGNEVELAGSNFMSPEDYYRRMNTWNYYAWYNTSPLVAGGGGVIVNSDLGRQWFTDYLNVNMGAGPYKPTVPYFHVHIYFRSTVAEWEADWNAFKALCGSKMRPTVISETNLYNVPADTQKALMDRILQIAGPSSGLHAVMWYADRDIFNQWGWCNLREINGTLTPLGNHFRSKNM